MNTKKIFILIKIIVPIILLYVVFSRINFNDLATIIKKANYRILIIALLNLPLLYFLYCLRWKILLQGFWKTKVSFLHLLKVFYEGFFLGYYLPGGIGLDAYRVINATKSEKKYMPHISIIVMEKICSLVSACFLVVVVSLLIKIDNQVVHRIIILGYIIIIAFIIITTLAFFFKTKTFVHKLIQKVEDFIILKIRNLMLKMYPDNIQSANSTSYFKEFIKPFSSFHFIGITLAFSLVMQILCAVFGQIILLGIGVSVPIIVNIFCSPLLSIITMLPVTFGGIGLREGSYIVIYGLFGISKESALLSSLITFFVIIFNILLGGLITLISNIRNTISTPQSESHKSC